MRDYSRFERLLHAAALSSDAVRRASFDLEQKLSHPDRAGIADAPHVFVTGLARSGTSLLLRTLYDPNEFAVQTYRDMPFVLAPGLWERVSRRHRLAGVARERAHGDGLSVSEDTPEAFEEVFWLTFAAERYLRADRLVSHGADETLIDSFRSYVAAVTTARGVRRYLSKNNNNLLRLGVLRRAFPNAVLVIPFRNPLDTAASLLRQHLRFTRLQEQDPFVLRYMNWLGHFEFGLNHRPVSLSESYAGFIGRDRTSLEYWLSYWTHVYRALLETAPDDAIFWSHDLFCQSPEAQLRLLAERLALRDSDKMIRRTDIRVPEPNQYEIHSSKTVRAAEQVHDTLLTRELLA